MKRRGHRQRYYRLLRADNLGGFVVAFVGTSTQSILHIACPLLPWQQEAKFCSNHAKEGMIKLENKRCGHPRVRCGHPRVRPNPKLRVASSKAVSVKPRQHGEFTTPPTCAPPLCKTQLDRLGPALVLPLTTALPAYA